MTLHIPFPGLSPDFQGLLQRHENVVSATTDFKFVALDVFVDEPNGTVTQFIEASGVNTGNGQFPTLDQCLYRGHDSPS